MNEDNINLAGTIPTYTQLMRPVLEILAKHEQRTLRELEDDLIEHLGLPPEARFITTPKGSSRRLYDRTSWALTYLHKAHQVDRVARGTYRITDSGRRIATDDAHQLDVQRLRQISPKFAAWYEDLYLKPKPNNDSLPSKVEPSAVQPSDATTESTPKERMDAAQSELTDALREELLQRLKNSSPDFFERAVLDLLSAMGYGIGDSTTLKLGGTGDGGVDGVIYQDQLGLDRVYVQAKRYDAQTVGAGDIRNFYGALSLQNSSKGVFFTTSTFSKSAKEAAERLDKQIVLMDGDGIAQRMIDHNVGCRKELTIEVKRIDDDYFE